LAVLALIDIAHQLSGCEAVHVGLPGLFQQQLRDDAILTRNMKQVPAGIFPTIACHT